MYQYGEMSMARLETVDHRLQQVFKIALSLGLIDISILQGMRNRDEQNRYYRDGRSRVPWPEGKHNVKEPGEKAKAVDAAPYIHGASFNYNHCCYLAGIILAVGKSLGVDIRWGGNWDMDGEPVTDQDFQDLVHYEVIGEK